MDINVKASNGEGHRVLREINRRCPACMKDVGQQQNAKRQRKTELFYVILFFVVIFIVALRIIGPIVITAWNLFFKS